MSDIRAFTTGLLFAALLVLNCSLAVAQDIDLGGATLEDLLNVKTTVATKKEVTARQSPGILSIITEEEIRNLGARDLIDVLNLIPGISFGHDVQGVVGMGIRGMWGHEGKMLLLVDGIEMNEIQYGTTQLGNEFPIHQIKRIEVIRGPGSVIYGGFAELAVINIITKAGADLNGAVAETTYGKMKAGSTRHNYGLQIGKKLDNLDVSVSGYTGKAKRGEGVYTGFNGTDYGSYDYKDADEIKPAYANLGVGNDKFNFRFIYNEYRVSSRSMFSYTGLDESLPNTFRSYSALLNYNLKLSKRLKIQPQVQYLVQVPWLQDSDTLLDPAIDFRYSDVESTRLKGSVSLHYDASKKLSWLFGLEATEDKHKIDRQYDSSGPVAFKAGGNDADFASHAAFAQAMYKLGKYDLTAGARYENPDFTETSFVPRAGITRAAKNWHGKLLYSQAFRTPVLFNINAKSDIRPETTETTELELGYATGRKSYLTANFFHTRITDPIVYFYDGDDQYDNFGSFGTQGAELDFRLRPSWGQVSLGYLYNHVHMNHVEKYRVANDSSMLVGMPQHKGTLNTWVNLGDPSFRLNTNVVYLGERWGYEYDYAAADLNLRKAAATALVNAFVSKDDLLVKGLSVGAGVFNVFNQDVRFIQPYAPTKTPTNLGGISPAPGPSREAVARIEYKSNF